MNKKSWSAFYFGLLCLLSTSSYAVDSMDDLESRVQTGVKSESVTSNRPKTMAEANKQYDSTIYATIDAPVVSNIVAWKDMTSKLEKNAIEFSVLQDSLTMTDKDQLMEETRYSRILNQKLTSSE